MDASARQLAFAAWRPYVELIDAKRRQLSVGTDAAMPSSQDLAEREIDESQLVPVLYLYSEKLKGALQSTGELQAKALWELIEILTIGSATRIVTEDIAIWYTTAYSSLDIAPLPGKASTMDMLAEIESRIRSGLSNDELETSDVFWNSILRMVALGWNVRVVDLLKKLPVLFHQRVSTPEYGALESLVLLLSKAPRLCLSETSMQAAEDGVRGTDEAMYTDVATFRQIRNRWLQQCRKLRDSNDVMKSIPTIKKSVTDTIAILTGEMEALKANSGTWLEIFVSSLIHRSPHTSVPQFEYLLLEDDVDCGAAIQQMQSDEDSHDSFSPEKVVFWTIKLEAQQIVAEMRKNARIGIFFITHIVDLLVEAGPEAEDDLCRVVYNGCTQEEMWRFEYCKLLMTTTSTWEICFQYLKLCPYFKDFGTHALLKSLPLLEDHKLACRVVSKAESEGLALFPLVGQLCSTLGMYHWENGQIAMAMQWFRRAGDNTRAKALIEHLMSMEETGEAFDVLLDSLHAGSETEDDDIGKRIAGLKQYRQIRESVRKIGNMARTMADLHEESNIENIQRECVKAATAITSTLRNRTLPQQRWFQILECAASLLTTARGLFSTDDKAMMLGVLEELEMDTKGEYENTLFDPDSLAKAKSSAFELRKRNRVRQALLANISCSIVHECQ